jgi:epoxyqueuosine reductase
MMENSIERLYNQMENLGLKARVVSIRHLPELQEELVDRNARGQFDREFYQERLTYFDFIPPAELRAARSLIMVAVPSPQTRVGFTWHGKKLSLILPPTYRGHDRIYAQTGEVLGNILAPEGYRLAQARLPQKLLFTRSGLAEYGRNNISYVPGMGSFYQPTVFFSDLPCEQDAWGEPRMLERCQTCKACMIKCPTGAISEDRFLLHAERCLVFHNERSASLPFPAWIDSAAHNSPVGCMLCQQFCPEDKPFLDWFEGDMDFDLDETSLIMQGTPMEQLPHDTRQKLEQLELMDYLDKLPRNLGVLFQRVT